MKELDDAVRLAMASASEEMMKKDYSLVKMTAYSSMEDHDDRLDDEIEDHLKELDDDDVVRALKKQCDLNIEN